MCRRLTPSLPHPLSLSLSLSLSLQLSLSLSLSLTEYVTHVAKSADRCLMLGLAGDAEPDHSGVDVVGPPRLGEPLPNREHWLG